MKPIFHVFVAVASSLTCLAQTTLKSGGFASSGAFQVQVDGGPLQVEASTNLTSWTADLNGRGLLVDPASTNMEWRFYRAHSGSGAGSNIIGFVRVPIEAGKLALVASPFGKVLQLDQPMARTVIFGTDKPPVQVSFMKDGKLTAYNFDELDNNWSPRIPEIPAGAAFLVRNGSNSRLTVRFGGEVPQGTLRRALPQGEAMVGSLVPKPGPVQDAIGAPGIDGAQIMVWNEQTQAYQTSTFERQINRWVPLLGYKPGRGVMIKFPEPSLQTTFPVAR